MVDTWADGSGRWDAIAPDARQAATAIRGELLTRGDIGSPLPADAGTYFTRPSRVYLLTTEEV